MQIKPVLDSIPSIKKVLSHNILPKTSLILSVILSKINVYLKAYEDAFKNLVRDNKECFTENGMLDTTSELGKSISEQIVELQEQEIPLKFKKIKISDFVDCKKNPLDLTGQTIFDLIWLIDTEETELEFIEKDQEEEIVDLKETK